jgi:Tol biopolymer transport system component
MEMFCIDPTTRQITQILADAPTDPYIDTFPTWSEDHSQIAFARQEPAQPRDIFVRHEDGTVKPLVEGGDDDWFPAWSRDGWIAFKRAGSDASIQRIRIGDDQPQPFAIGTDLRAPAWSADGSRLAFFGHQGDNDYDLGFVTSRGGEPQWITTTPDTTERNPAWSPDGRTLVYVSGSSAAGDEDNDIWLMDADTGQVIARLTGQDESTGKGVQDGNPVWSPDGSQIAFYRKTAEDGYHIWIMNLDGSGQEDLMLDRSGSNLDPNWR